MPYNDDNFLNDLRRLLGLKPHHYSAPDTEGPSQSARGFKIELGDDGDDPAEAYGDSPIGARRPEGNNGFVSASTLPGVPERIHRMIEMYEQGMWTDELRAKNFYRQGQFMADYTDNQPWRGPFSILYSTYHDLNIRQLRGYFTWRTRLREGIYEPTPASFAYIYLYELINCIGCSSPADALERMEQFEVMYIGQGFGDVAMERNLHTWMLQFIIVNGLSREKAQLLLHPSDLLEDKLLDTLRAPSDADDSEVVDALRRIAKTQLYRSPVLTKLAPAEGEHLLAEVWRYAVDTYRDPRGKNLFTLCFGEQATGAWRPFSNAVYHQPEGNGTSRRYYITPCRQYRCELGQWTETRYALSQRRETMFKDFCRCADRLLRSHFGLRGGLRPVASEAWVEPIIAQAIAEATRPKIEIDLSHLDRIRTDAATTRESLLTDEERQAEATETAPQPQAEAPQPAAADAAPLPLADELEVRVVRALLAGSDPTAIIREARRMPSVVADSINEQLFDAIADNVIELEGDRLSLVDDYIDELREIFS